VNDDTERRLGASERPAAARPAGADGGEDFLSGTSGTVGGLDARRRRLLDALIDARALLTGQRARLYLAARREPPVRRVCIIGVQRREHRALARRAHAELLRSRHDVRIHTTTPGSSGKFENLNRLLREHSPQHDGSDWLLLLDDDILLPRGFLDRTLLLAERLHFDLAQPAHRLYSHAAWPITRRQPGVLARRTCFVEIGPVTLLARSTFATLLPFPELRMGWGLDLHWAAAARTHGWRLGILDAVAIAHTVAPPAGAYSREQAIAEARRFLASHTYLKASEAQRTLARYTAREYTAHDRPRVPPP
jgi:hypothetical protein